MKFLILLITLLLIQPAFGAVMEISEMKISVHVAEKAHFKYEITLKNLIDKPLVPGISELRLQKVENLKLLVFPLPLGEKRAGVDIENLRAYSGNMNFKSYYEKHEEYSSIYYEIWYPIEPLGEKKIVVEFDADIVDRGLLFKSITFPVGSDIDVRDLQISISSDWNLCYREGEVKSIPANHIAFFAAEFSLLPLPMLPIRGYLFFWGIVFTVALLAFLIRKKL
uniref:DUF2207 domain-containing protein n=1 Tax=Archaeoglobus fulgidus TaxID=2234 RepID=A0A7J2TKC6_ARCFL